MSTRLHHVTGKEALATAGAVPPSNELMATAGSVLLPADDGAPEWVKLFPYGTFTGRDGRGPYTVRDQAHGQAIVAATTAYQAGADAPIDYEHQTQRAGENGQAAPASGWFKSFQARPDGVYGQTEWTARAGQHLAAKEYRYISPAFTHDKAGNVLRIVGAGLTNLPNLEIPAIASQEGHDSMTLEELLKQIRAACGLPVDATAETVTAHCQKLQKGAGSVAVLLGLAENTAIDQLATAAQAAVTALATTLKVEVKTLPELATAAQKLITGPAIDLTKYVPMEVHTAVASQLAALQGKTASTEADRAVEDAIKAGKVTPALKDWALAMAAQSLAAFKEYVAKAPVLVATASQQSPATPGVDDGKQGLDDAELAVCKQLGIKAEDFLKTKKGAA